MQIQLYRVYKKIPMKFPAVIILLGLLFQTNCAFTFKAEGRDHSTIQFECLRPSVNGRVILDFIYFLYRFDERYVESVYNAYKAGLKVQVLIRPTRSREPDEQLTFVKQALEVPIDRIWVLVGPAAGYTPQKCRWGIYTPEENCLYLQKLLSEAKKQQINIGFLVLKESWIEVMKNTAACPEIATAPLWSYDQQSTPIGGWQSPYMKHIGNTTICKAFVTVNKIISSAEI